MISRKKCHPNPHNTTINEKGIKEKRWNKRVNKTTAKIKDKHERTDNRKNNN